MIWAAASSGRRLTINKQDVASPLVSPLARISGQTRRSGATPTPVRSTLSEVMIGRLKLADICQISGEFETMIAL